MTARSAVTKFTFRFGEDEFAVEGDLLQVLQRVDGKSRVNRKS